ncbi:hypothetical protein D3C81_1430620 [compost metagenome]
MVQRGAEKHRGDQQYRGEQSAAQHPLVVRANADQVDDRDQHHQQDRPIPEPGKNPQGFTQCRLTLALGQRQDADHVSDRAAHADHQQAEGKRGRHPGEHRNAAGEIATQLMGDLLAGQGIAQGHQKADNEQRSGTFLADDLHRPPLVPGIEHHHQRHHQ